VTLSTPNCVVAKALEPPPERLLSSAHEMNEVSEAIARWLEQKRRRDRVSAAVIAVLALGSGAAVFLVTSLLVYAVLTVVCGVFTPSALWLGLVALGLTGAIFFGAMTTRPEERQTGLDPLGYWILQDIGLAGPRLILAGLRQVRCCGELGQLNVTACAQALGYLAGQNQAVAWHDLAAHCPLLAGARLREQLSLLDGVLFLGEKGARVTLMDPFRARLRWMLEQEPARPRPQPAPPRAPVTEPETLTAHEILGLPPAASVMEIKRAYRKRVKECHPDLFAGMDPQAKALAERWTRALNAAYATLNPRPGRGRPGSPAPR
jgi:hypothetical protein